ncbi:MAG: hypothetical protein LBC17_03660 [Lactobacillaceae bacterium]|jgi:hypothetical protein|nr:hypothetical protein [Lactobacillaceae bacterium]
MNQLKLNQVKTNGLKIASLMVMFLASGPIFLSGALGMKDIKIIAVIKQAYTLWKAGSTVRAAFSAATGGWGWAVNIFLQFGIAYLASQNFKGSWVVGF